MPIFFAHIEKPFFGLIHVGWRGLVNGILNCSAKILLDNKYNLFDFEIIVGPSIQSCCFEVQKDIVKQFNQSFVFPKNEGKFNVNLQAQALNDLASIGFDINKVNIFEDCTFCEEKKYHSYRRSSNDVGRMIGLIGIKR